MSAIGSMGSKAPSTVVPQVQFTKNGWLPRSKCSFTNRSNSDGSILPLFQKSVRGFKTLVVIQTCCRTEPQWHYRCQIHTLLLHSSLNNGSVKIEMYRFNQSRLVRPPDWNKLLQLKRKQKKLDDNEANLARNVPFRADGERGDRQHMLAQLTCSDVNNTSWGSSLSPMVLYFGNSFWRATITAYRLEMEPPNGSGKSVSQTFRENISI